MPRFDKTGPEGRGSGTGRGLGGCPTRRRVIGKGRTLPQEKDKKTESLRERKKKLEEELEDVEKEL